MSWGLLRVQSLEEGCQESQETRWLGYSAKSQGLPKRQQRTFIWLLKLRKVPYLSGWVSVSNYYFNSPEWNCPETLYLSCSQPYLSSPQFFLLHSLKPNHSTQPVFYELLTHYQYFVYKVIVPSFNGNFIRLIQSVFISLKRSKASMSSGPSLS